jgi:F-type H+-transporting ATPase subunit b
MEEPATPANHESPTSAGSLAHTEAADHGPTSLGLGAEGWVYVGLTIFILLAIFVGKAPKRIAEALDARIADTRRQLDEAKAIRVEAETLLADARQRQQAAAAEASAIMQQAQTEASAMVEQAERNAETLIARRTRMAEDKIGAAERSAIAEVRARAAEAATSAATALIVGRHDADADKALVDRSIADLHNTH